MNAINVLVELMENHRNDEQSLPMQKYMKDHFSFLGIKTPKRREILRAFYKETSILKVKFSNEFVLALWSMEEREYQYAALDYTSRYIKKLTSKDITFMEYLITTKSWWDTVDTIATQFVGSLASFYPEVRTSKIEEWAHSENIWLVRTAILFQLKYKEQTDEELLYRYILLHSESKEFFIQKAIGWSLREYSKTNPKSVKNFIRNHQLAKLSVREGSKYI